ncbi:hypothetical protein GCM10022259_15450 [Aquimarina mytili]
MLGVYCTLTFGQDLPDLTPPTPEVAAMGKYTDIPIGLHTGTANISIPLVNLSESGIDVPVSVNYHSSGIRVNEMSSRVGLGWSLTAGGMINRSVRGIADDLQEGYINTQNTIENFLTLTGTPKDDQIRLVNDKKLDFESDIYNFSFPGYSGKFFFDQNGGIYTHPKSDLKITYTKDNHQKIVGWSVTTAMGITYTFGTIPGTNNYVLEEKYSSVLSENAQLPLSIQAYTSGWYLTEIKHYNGERITFTYQEGTAQIVYYNLLDQNKYLHALGATQGSGNCSTNLQPTATLSEDKYYPKFLTSIQSTQGSIEFSYDHTRVDLKNDFAVTKVELKDNNSTVIESYNLEYDYFTTSPKQYLGMYGDTDQRTKKLYLKAIKQQKGSAINKQHTFSYYQDHIFPERLSFNQDLWGYANGKDNDVFYPSLVYTAPILSGGTMIQIPREVIGADRNVDESFAKTLMLKEITYPTGGKTEFIYEANTLSGGEKFFVGNSLVTKQISGGQLGNDPSKPGQTFTKSFTFNGDGYLYYKIDVEQSCPADYNDCPAIRLYRANGEIIRTFDTQNSALELLNATAGDYTIVIENGPFQTGNYVSIRFFEKVTENGINPNNSKTGGLRIKELRYKDHNGSIVNTKKYNYQTFGNSAISSGQSLNPPVFLKLRVMTSQGCNNDIIYSNARFPLNGQSSLHVGYTNVTEYNTDGTQGKTEYTYDFSKDPNAPLTNILGGEEFLTTPSIDFSHRRGLLLNKKIYRHNNITSQYQLIEETDNTYKKLGGVGINNVVVGLIGTGPTPIFELYSVFGDRYLMEKNTSTSYQPSGDIKTTTQYNYDTGYYGRTMPREISTTNSLGETVVTKSFYPDDVATTTSLGKVLSTEAYQAINYLKAAHRIGELIQQETWVGGQKMSTQRTNFKLQNGNTLPKTIQSAKLERDLDDRIEYVSYDTKGNPLEVKQSGGSHIIYIWGYQDNYPIAKIVNASYTDMPADVTTLINNLKVASNHENNTTEEQAMRDLVDQLRVHSYFDGAEITSYTHDPLIGLTSVTDPRGYTMKYYYDNFNRLEYVKDDAGKLISENKYNYKN